MITTPGLSYGVGEAEYFASPSLSQSDAKLILRSPAHYRWQKDHPREQTSTFDFGHAAHRLILGVGADIRVIDARDWRTNLAKAERDEAYEAGQIPLLAKDYQVVQDMADKLSQHELAMELLSEGSPEVTACAVDEATGVTMRGRFDWLGERILSDYKSAASSEPAEFCRAAVRYGYDLQAAFYLDLAAANDHPASGFVHLVQEKEPPYVVTVVVLPAELIERGRALKRRALEVYRDCTEAGKWPGYVRDDEFATPSAPAWALRDLEEETA